MQAVLLRCKPRSRFHFGLIAPDENTSLNTAGAWLPSDTLFSAIINVLAEINPEGVAGILQDFEQGKVLISSGFYVLEYIEDERKIYFLPKPAHYGTAVSHDFKTYNRVKLISKTVWEAGWLPDEWPEHCIWLQNGEVLAAKRDLPETMTAEQARAIRLYEMEDYPRVKVHTQSRQNNLYYVTTSGIADNTEALPGSSVHLYFLFDTTDADFEKSTNLKDIKIAIRMLADRGLGGERNVGCGLFEKADFVPFDAPQIGQNAFVTASLALPAAANLTKFLYYQVVTRGGRKYGSADKRFDFVRLLAEGAYTESKPEGGLAVIGKNEGHDVRRYGKPFFLETHPVTPQP